MFSNCHFLTVALFHFEALAAFASFNKKAGNRPARAGFLPFGWSGLQQIHLLGRFGQFIAEFGVGDADERLGAVLGALAAQLGDAVFGDDVVDVVFAGGHVRAGRERGGDGQIA